MRVYVGDEEGAVRVVDGARSYPLEPRLDLAQHSPTGFSWGYAGSGPAQLALAILADLTGDDQLALQSYQRFKERFVATLPFELPWSAPEEELRQLLETCKV